MAFTDPGAIAPNDVVTSTYLNNIRASLLATGVAVSTTKGDLAVATGSQAVARLAVGANDATLTPASGEATGLAWQIVPAARAYNSAAFSFSATTWTSVTLDSERIDTDAMHSTVTNTERMTVPAGGDGLYLIGACADIRPDSGSQDGNVGLRILLNGTTILVQDLQDQRGAAAITLCVSTLYSLIATDYIEMQVYSTAGSDAEAVGNYSPELWITWQRRP